MILYVAAGRVKERMGAAFVKNFRQATQLKAPF